MLPPLTFFNWNVRCPVIFSSEEVTSMSILSAIEVVVGVFVSFAVFHESMTVLQGVGAVIIIFGALYPNLVLKYRQVRLK